MRVPKNRQRKYKVLVEVTLSQLQNNTHKQAVAVVRALLEGGERRQVDRGDTPKHDKFTTKSYTRHITSIRAIAKGSQTATWRHIPKAKQG